MDIMDKNGQNGQKWTKWTKRIKTYAGKMSLQLQITFTRFQSTTIRSQIVQIIQNTPFRRIAIQHGFARFQWKFGSVGNLVQLFKCCYNVWQIQEEYCVIFSQHSHNV